MSGDKYLDQRMRQVRKCIFLEGCIVLELVCKVGNESSMVGTVKLPNRGHPKQ